MAAKKKSTKPAADNQAGIELTEDQQNTLKMLLPSYPAEEKLIVPRDTLPQELRAEILSAERVKLLVAGQRGMGKTTELERLVHLLDGTKILPLFVQFGAQHSISLQTLIQTMARQLLEHQDAKLTKKDKDSFLDWFAVEEEVYIAEEGSEGAAAIGGKIPLLSAERGIHHSKSTQTKRTKQIDKTVAELIATFNKLISIVRKRTNTRPAFIVDDIDKIQDPSSVENTFIHNSHIIDDVDAPCIFTVPITYATSSSLRIATLPYGTLYRVPAVPLRDKYGNRNEQQFEFMRTVLTRRMPFNPLSKELLDKILEYSGGVLVEAMKMARGVCKRAALDPEFNVDGKAVDAEFQKLVDDYQFVFDTPALWEKLAELCKSDSKTIIMTDDSKPMLLYRMIVIEYRDDTLWFDLHPAARRLYEMNARFIDARVAEYKSR